MPKKNPSDFSSEPSVCVQQLKAGLMPVCWSTMGPDPSTMPAPISLWSKSQRQGAILSMLFIGGFGSRSEGYIYELSKAISEKWPHVWQSAQFIWELSKLVIWQLLFSEFSELRFHTTGGAFCNPHPQLAETESLRQTTFCSQVRLGNLAVEGGGWVCVVALGCQGGHTHSWGKERGGGEGIHTFSLPSAWMNEWLFRLC